MIEVVKHGKNKSPQYIYEVQCDCGCVFTCSYDDWRRDVITGHGQRDSIIVCPECHRNLYFSLLQSEDKVAAIVAEDPNAY